MAKEKMVTQAYACTLIINGAAVEPGTAVTLPESEAASIAAVHGTAPVKAKHKPEPAKQEPVKPDPAKVKALEEAEAAYAAAEKAMAAEGSGDAELEAFTKAENALEAAKAALA